MKKKNLFKIVLCNFFLIGCSSTNKIYYVNNRESDPIKIAIIDFLDYRKFRTDDTVFIITVKNIRESILGINIFAEKNKVAVISSDEKSYSYSSFPNNFIETNGKLFYWKDSTKQKSLELIAKLAKMDRIDTAIVGKYLPNRIIDDSQKGVNYYFCNSDLKKYKRVITSVAIGFYKIPEFICPAALK
ncbi:MAG: hypothetical protein WKF88_02090 [Ferruginibacter sp.]